MDRVVRWGVIGLVALVATVALAAALAWLYSESVIERHYPLLSQDVPRSGTPDVIARGARLAKLMGCFGCHGDHLEGRPIARDSENGQTSRIYAPNLTRSAETDEEFARAVRFGLNPDGKSLWVMPSQAYTYMSVADMAALISYVRALKPRGAQTPPMKFEYRDRLAIIDGDLVPVASRVNDGGGSLDLGPRYDGGRYIARTTCSGCHGLDLAGTPDGRIPSLNAIARYRLRDFFGLLRDGHGPDWRPTPAMKALARTRFSEFKDYEIMALYDYLSARAAALPPSDRQKLPR